MIITTCKALPFVEESEETDQFDKRDKPDDVIFKQSFVKRKTYSYYINMRLLTIGC